MAYGGGDILVSGAHNKQNSPEECQAACQCITNCVHFTWFSASTGSENFCELKTDDGTVLPFPGAISGPKNC